MGQKGIILLSGGMDSGVLLAHSVASYTELRALTLLYGSKQSAREAACAKKLALQYDVEHSVIDMQFLKSLLHSSLLQESSPVPDGTYDTVNMRSTVVPFRNGIFLALGVALAEDLSFHNVLIGSHAGDSAVYPDCRQKFTATFSDAAALGTYNQVKISSPFSALTKKQIAQIGKELEFDFQLTWTCYNSRSVHCGTCAACNSRKQALDFHLGKDPTEYEAS